jgi:hypothetical protein
MKRLTAGFALTTLAAASLALAQTAQTPDTSAPPADTQSQMQSQPPSDQSPGSQGSDQSTTQSGSADKDTLMKNCISQVQASNPNVSSKDITDFCDREVNRASSSPQ